MEGTVMNTTIILTQNVKGLGTEGDKVTVKPGYARNYLLPRGIATLATASNVRHIEALKKKKDAREAAEKVASEEFAAKISKLACSITVKVGQNNKMFGSVTAGDIHEFLTKNGVEVERKQIALEKAIHQVGDHPVAINLLHGVTAHLTVKVVAAEPEAAPAHADRRGGRRPERTERPERKPAEKKAE